MVGGIRKVLLVHLKKAIHTIACRHIHSPESLYRCDEPKATNGSIGRKQHHEGVVQNDSSGLSKGIERSHNNIRDDSKLNDILDTCSDQP